MSEKNKNLNKAKNSALNIADVSGSLLREKAKEYAKFIYDEGYDDPMYQPDVMQSMRDFEAGFKAGLRFSNDR